MRSIVYKIFLSITCLAYAVQGYCQQTSQTCNGSLGDPVINQDFGSGANPGGPLAAGITTMTYTANSCPEDGYYTIVNNLSGSANCHQDTWHNVYTDHTGNTNGYMMVVNASEQPSVFFTQTANGLCPNTTYEFSSYILNLITLAASKSTANGSVSEPDITFTIQTTDGQILATSNTGTIPPTADVYWYKYGAYFTTPSNVTDVVVKMTNNAPGGNGNDLILDDITFRACGPVIQSGIGTFTGPVSQSFCVGENVNLTLKSSVTGGVMPPYQWQVNYNDNGWQDIAGVTSDNTSIQTPYTVAGTYQYRMGVSNGSAISSSQCRVYSSPITIIANPLPVIPAIAPQTVCVGATLQLTASGGSAYQWSGPGIASSTQNPLVINNVTAANAGTYTVQVTTDKGCTTTPVQTTVKVVPKIVPQISGAVTVCAGTSTQLTASGGLYYKWTPSAGLDHDDIANPIATPLQTTTYTVDISNDGCDDNSQSVTVTVNQLPVASAGSNKIISAGQSVKLNGSVTGDNIISTSWTPTTGLSDPSSLTPVATPTEDITYTLTVVSSTCGQSTSTVFVRVYQQVNPPNVFTPNGDLKNDYWVMDALSTYPESITQVFNRYGQVVFQTRGYASPWDGKQNGKPVPAGTYYYIIDLNNNTPKLKGWLVIIR